MKLQRGILGWVRNEVAAGYVGMSEERSCSGMWKGGCGKELKL